MLKGPKKSVTVLMPLELYERVKEQAKQTSRSVPGYVRQVLKYCLEHGEEGSI